jgi:uncharacterized repeat protein (TIGR03803 family)
MFSRAGIRRAISRLSRKVGREFNSQHRRCLVTRMNACKARCALLVTCVTVAIVSRAQTFTTLVSFNGTDGVYPYGTPVQGINGDLYGTTLGTVFEMTAEGTLTTLLTFDFTDGSSPYAGVILGTDGNFYGTTGEGGANTCLVAGTDIGCGTVFKITPGGALTTLYSFCSQANCTDGYFPRAALVQGSNGNLYGTTQTGGNSACNFEGSSGCGTVFEITRAGKLTTLYTFNGLDGQSPIAGLIQSSSGNFYGTTYYGGAYTSCGYGVGCGTIFEMTPEGTLTTLHSFDSTDGAFPAGGLVQGTDGTYYGTTSAGGANPDACFQGCGTVFKMTGEGMLTTLLSFDGADGFRPEAGLIEATDGNFYGITDFGGANCAPSGCGTIFEMTPGAALTTLYSFCAQANCTDGENPYAGLVQATNGNFYGTTFGGGGSDGYGTVFSLSVGLGPFVETIPTSGKAGSEVGILGNDLKGATSVTFNGTPAQFTVKSPTLILTHVPTGASTGTVQLALPKGTLSSNVPFYVIP